MSISGCARISIELFAHFLPSLLVHISSFLSCDWQLCLCNAWQLVHFMEEMELMPSKILLTLLPLELDLRSVLRVENHFYIKQPLTYMYLLGA